MTSISFAGAGRGSWIVEQAPDRGVGIRDGRNHAMSSRTKVEDISARFWSISSSEGPGPYCGPRRSRRDFFAVLTGGTCSGIEARIGSIAWRTTCSGVVPASRAFAGSLACPPVSMEVEVHRRRLSDLIVSPIRRCLDRPTDTNNCPVFKGTTYDVAILATVPIHPCSVRVIGSLNVITSPV